MGFYTFAMLGLVLILFPSTTFRFLRFVHHCMTLVIGPLVGCAEKLIA
jgi:hypothetical protein